MSIGYGRDVFQPTNIEIMVWNRRLAYECGAFAPLQIPLPDLPDDASPEAQRARDGFALLVGLRWADYRQRPVSFAVRFVAAWCGLTFRQARAAINELTAHGVIRQAGKSGRTPLYEPGRPIVAGLLADRSRP